MLTVVLVAIAIVVLYLLNSIKILREYERGVIFRLGRALPTPKGPGIILVFRPFDQMIRISLRQEVLEVPPQDVITRDNVTIKVNAVVTLYVDDDGPGIPESEMERVFLPFHRLESSRNRETGGVGLGLPIARNILRAHGGDVALANRPTGGLKATVTLPM